MAVEVCEERVLLSVTPVISQSQAQTDVSTAQTAYNTAVSTYDTTSQGIIAGYDAAMLGHSTDFTNNVATLGGSYDTAVLGIQGTHSANVPGFQSGFDASVAGFETTLAGNYATSESTYATATTGHSNTFNASVASIEAGLDASIAAADAILGTATTTASNQFTSTESTASGQYDADIALADNNYSTAVSGHDAWLQSQEAAAFTTYETATGNGPTGAMGIYNATETTEAATRDGVLSSYPNTTYDPQSVSSIDFDAIWNTALSGVQSALTTAETNYETAVNNAIAAYNTGMVNAAATYSSMMLTADQNRDAAYATADGTYNTNITADWNDYNNAVSGPGGIEDVWQTSIDTADANYSSAVTSAMSGYDSAVQAAQATLDSDIAASHQEFDDWLNGNQTGQSISASFTRIKTTDASTTPATVTWTSTSRVEWSATEGTSTESEFTEEPPVPAGYTWVSTTTVVSGSVTTVTETYDAPAGGIGGGSAAHNNPWELAKIARTEFYIAELNEYYDQYVIDMNAASLAYDGSVAAADVAYYTTLYGNSTGVGMPAPGTPADAFNNAISGAATSFSTDEQTAYSTYDTNINAFNMAQMQYEMDIMMGLPATPPNPNDPAQFAKDYFVDVTALDINFAVATGSAWTAWVSAQLAADTTRDNAIINAEYQLGVDQADAGNNLITSQIGAEDSFAKDIIDIDADYTIAVMEKSADIEGDIADHELAFELAEHGAAQTAGKAINLAEKDREHDYADADETQSEALSLEDEDLANDLAAEEETRENSYATAESGWLSAQGNRMKFRQM